VAVKFEEVGEDGRIDEAAEERAEFTDTAAETAEETTIEPPLIEVERSLPAPSRLEPEPTPEPAAPSPLANAWSEPTEE
jgi:hypothetical protein